MTLEAAMVTKVEKGGKLVSLVANVEMDVPTDGRAGTTIETNAPRDGRAGTIVDIDAPRFGRARM